MSETLAGKFACHVPPGFEQHTRKILYVGKATAGEFAEEHAADIYFDGRSAFWSFARSVSQIADPTCEDLSNLAWSNIFKQGVSEGNPLGAIAEQQREKAAAELRKEVDVLKPSLLILANAGYYEEIPKAAYLIGSDELSNVARTAVIGEKKLDLWSRPSFANFPPIVWMYHPQGKRKEYLDAALALIRQLTGW